MRTSAWKASRFMPPLVLNDVSKIFQAGFGGLNNAALVAAGLVSQSPEMRDFWTLPMRGTVPQT